MTRVKAWWLARRRAKVDSLTAPMLARVPDGVSCAMCGHREALMPRQVGSVQLWLCVEAIPCVQRMYRSA